MNYNYFKDDENVIDAIENEFMEEIKELKKNISDKYLDDFLILLADSWLLEDEIGLDFFEKRSWTMFHYLSIRVFIEKKKKYLNELTRSYTQEKIHKYGEDLFFANMY